MTKTMGYFICNEPHRVEDCPKIEKVLVLMTAKINGVSYSNVPLRSYLLGIS